MKHKGFVSLTSLLITIVILAGLFMVMFKYTFTSDDKNNPSEYQGIDGPAKLLKHSYDSASKSSQKIKNTDAHIDEALKSY